MTRALRGGYILPGERAVVRDQDSRELGGIEDGGMRAEWQRRCSSYSPAISWSGSGSVTGTGP